VIQAFVMRVPVSYPYLWVCLLRLFGSLRRHECAGARGLETAYVWGWPLVYNGASKDGDVLRQQLFHIVLLRIATDL